VRGMSSSVVVVYRCPFFLCTETAFTSYVALRGHVARSHLNGQVCQTCGMQFVGVESFLDHFAGGGCQKPRGREKRGAEREEEVEAPREARNAFDAARDGEQVWVDDLEVLTAPASAPFVFPIPDAAEFEESMLDLFVADLRAGKSGGSIESRQVSAAVLQSGFVTWWKNRTELGDRAGESDNSVAGKLAALLTNGKVEKQSQRNIFAWLRTSVGPLMVDVERNRLPATFDEFRNLLDERSDLIVETPLCSNPLIVFFHIPLLLALEEVILAPDTVQHARSPADVDAPIRVFCDGEKFSLIRQNVGSGMCVAVWSLFVDKTRLVQHGTRKGHVVLACPLNNPRGRFDIVGFVPTITNEAAVQAGVAVSKAPLWRAHLQQQALRVVLLYGGFRIDSPLSVVTSDAGKMLNCRNVLGSVRVDGEELCSVVCRVISASANHAKELACYRHRIDSHQLSEVVANPDVEHNFYSHNNDGYRAFVTSMLVWGKTVPEATAKKGFRKYGMLPIEPAVMDAYLFDSAQDVVGDIHHVGPHGIGLFLLHQLAAALRAVFPAKDGCGKVTRDVIPIENAEEDHLIELSRGDEVTMLLHVPQGVEGRQGYSWVRDVENREGFVPSDALCVTRAFDEEAVNALREFDKGLRVASGAYIHSYKTFDFRSLEEAAASGSALFARATTVETVLLYAPFILAFVLRERPAARWITDTFLMYNRFYWNWRREVFVPADGVVMDQQRFELKTLMKNHWAAFSKTELNFMKFEQLDHVVHDLRRHGTVRYTGTGPGDNAHIRVAKIPFRASNKTKDEAALNLQLLAFGSAPSFLVRGAEQAGQEKRVGFVGEGGVCTLNFLIVLLARSMKAQNWEEDVVNQSLAVFHLLHRRYVAQFGGSALSFEKFTLWRATVHHSARIGNVAVYASDSYHGARRHDFVRLVDGSICRVVALLSLKVPMAEEVPLALVEDTVEENVQALSMLATTIISESSTWRFVGLDMIGDVVACLPHPEARAWHFVIRKKHDDTLWR
jgi:hypothetical protein